MDLLNKFICTRAYTSYLELGVGRGVSFGGVYCARKVGVDPAADSHATVHLTSDAFFAGNRDKFDVVFIDGLHRSEQVLRDINNALAVLNPGGVVLLHDCLPITAHMASDSQHDGEWCGDVYRAAAWYFAHSPYRCYTVDADYGIGVIDTAHPAESRPTFPGRRMADLTYDAFSAVRTTLLRVVNVDQVDALVAQVLAHPPVPENRPLYVITPTGDRPDAFALCIDYMNRQTRKPDMWLIVDDGRSDAVAALLPRVKIPYRVIALPAREEDTLLRNLSAALSQVPDDAAVCVVEDDDWYPAHYLETVYGLLGRADFVSTKECRYYHVNTRQYRILGGSPTHGDCFSGPAVRAFRTWVASGVHASFDNKFGHSWAGTRAKNGAALPAHIVGFGLGRGGLTPSHRIGTDARGWTADPEGCQLAAWIGSDVRNYLAPSSAKVYVVSNVAYPESRKLNVSPDDLLVFLNKAASLDYYEGHANKVLYRRKPAESYGPERLCIRNRYVFDAGTLGIPDSFIRGLRAEYDWDYPIEKGKVRSMTTGYMVARYMTHLYPLREVVLVNFGYGVSKSTYRCPWHNWVFEAKALSGFRHIFTADTAPNKGQ